MQDTKKALDARAVVIWALRMGERFTWRATRVIREVRVGLERPKTPRSAPKEKPAPAAKRPKRVVTRKAS
jgi:hypothetical protein